MNEEENNTSGFWLGMILGGAIGAVAGYLLHSEDKRKALEEIKEKGKLLLENLGEFKDEMIEKGARVKETVQAEVVEVVDEVPQVAKEAIEKVEKAAAEAVKNISDSVKSSGSRIDPRKKGFGKIFFKKGEALVKK